MFMHSFSNAVGLSPSAADAPHITRLLIADGAGGIGAQVSLLAVPTVAVIVLAASPQQTSLLTSVQWLPALLFAGLLGRAVDRGDRRSALVLGAVLEALGAAAVVSVLLMPDDLRFFALLVGALLVASGGLVYSLAGAAALPSLLSHTPPPDAFAAQATVRSMARVSGQALAAALTQALGAVVAMGVSAVLAIVRALAAMQLPQLRIQRAESSVDGRNSRGRWSLLAASPHLLDLTLANTLMTLGGAIVLSVFFPFAYQDLQLTPFSVGAMLFVGGVAAVLTGRIGGKTVRRFGPIAIAIGSGATATLSAWLIALAKWGPSLVTLIVYEVIFSASAVLFAVAFNVVRQRVVANDDLATVASTTSTLTALCMVAGGLIAAVVVPTAGVYDTIVAGCIVSSAAALNLLRLLRLPALSKTLDCERGGP